MSKDSEALNILNQGVLSFISGLFFIFTVFNLQAYNIDVGFTKYIFNLLGYLFIFLGFIITIAAFKSNNIYKKFIKKLVSNILGTLYLFSIAQIAINIAFLYKEQHIELVIISIIYLLLIGAAEFSIISNTIKEGKISNNIATLLFCLTLLFEGIAIYFYFKNGHILQVIQYAVLGIITLIATIYVFNKTRKKKEIQGKNMVNGLDRNNSSKKN
jgi:hypothetical protein